MMPITTKSSTRVNARLFLFFMEKCLSKKRATKKSFNRKPEACASNLADFRSDDGVLVARARFRLAVKPGAHLASAASKKNYAETRGGEWRARTESTAPWKKRTAPNQPAGSGIRMQS